MLVRLSLLLIFQTFTFIAVSQVAASDIDSLRKIIAAGKQDANEARAYNYLAEIYIRQDAAKAKSCLHTATQIGLLVNNGRVLSNSYSQMVTLFQNAGNMDSARNYLMLLKALAENKAIEDAEAIRANYDATAGLYYKKMGNLNQAIPFFKKAILYANKTGSKSSNAGQLLNLGNTYMNLGDYKNAFENHLKALRLFEELGNQKGESFCYQSISNSFIELKEYDKAYKYAMKSAEIKTVLNDRRGLGTTQSSLGLIFIGLKNYQKAMTYFNSALAIARELKLVNEEAKINFNIGKLYAAKKDKSSAAGYFNQSKALARQVGDSSSVAAADVQLIALNTEEKPVSPEEKKLAGSIEMLKSTGNLNRQVIVYKNMADFYASNDEYEKAFLYTNKFHQMNDSLQSNDLKLQMKEMENRYNIDKKEKEIAILKKDQELNRQQLKQQKLLLTGSIIFGVLAICGIWLLINKYRMSQKVKELQLRNQIAADLHDEVGSSLSSIHLLSQMAGSQQESGTSKDILSRMSNNAHETMEKMSDIVWMIKPGENESNNLTQRMQRFLFELCAHKSIEYNIKADDVNDLKLSMLQRKNLYLVFKEAVNNAVKYANTQMIEVVIQFEDHVLTLLVKDHGKGFEVNSIIKGNGLDNMAVRAQELHGSFNINSRPGFGTEIQLQFPLKSNNPISVFHIQKLFSNLHKT